MEHQISDPRDKGETFLHFSLSLKKKAFGFFPKNGELIPVRHNKSIVSKASKEEQEVKVNIYIDITTKHQTLV